MSHVVKNTNASGRIVSIEALRLACQSLGTLVLEDVEENAKRLGIEPVPGRARYRTWVSDHNRLAGDWDVPEGMTAEDVGQNATYVIRASEAGRAIAGKDAYEIGLVWSDEEQCYQLTYDFFCNINGLGKLVGSTEVQNNSSNRGGILKASCPKLMQAYNIARDKLMAASQGDTLVTLHDGSTVIGSPSEIQELLAQIGNIQLQDGDSISMIDVGDRLSLEVGG